MLRRMSVPRGILVIMTLYATKEEPLALERMLYAARWQSVRKKPAGRAAWAPRANVIVSAVREGGRQAMRQGEHALERGAGIPHT